MKFALKKIVPAVAAAALLGSSFAWAQAPVAPPSPVPGESARSVLPGEAVPLPNAQVSGTTSYVTGGIPYEQLPAFTQARGQYPLNIEIYELDGRKQGFTADADVKLIASNGDVVLDAKAGGPYLWAKVPPGTYRLQTTLNGKMKESRVSVNGSRSTRAVVVFPDGTSPD